MALCFLKSSNATTVIHICFFLKGKAVSPTSARQPGQGAPKIKDLKMSSPRKGVSKQMRKSRFRIEICPLVSCFQPAVAHKCSLSPALFLCRCSSRAARGAAAPRAPRCGNPLGDRSQRSIREPRRPQGARSDDAATCPRNSLQVAGGNWEFGGCISPNISLLFPRRNCSLTQRGPCSPQVLHAQLALEQQYLLHIVIHVLITDHNKFFLQFITIGIFSFSGKKNKIALNYAERSLRNWCLTLPADRRCGF